jgi:hypothetical protein
VALTALVKKSSGIQRRVVSEDQATSMSRVKNKASMKLVAVSSGLCGKHEETVRQFLGEWDASCCAITVSKK